MSSAHQWTTPLRPRTPRGPPRSGSRSSERSTRTGTWRVRRVATRTRVRCRRCARCCVACSRSRGRPRFFAWQPPVTKQCMLLATCDRSSAVRDVDQKGQWRKFEVCTASCCAKANTGWMMSVKQILTESIRSTRFTKCAAIVSLVTLEQWFPKWG